MISQDESKIDDYGVKKEDWKVIKDEYLESNPSDETSVLVDAYKKSILANLQRNKTISVLSYILEVKGDWKDYFDLAKLKYTGDSIKDASYLRKQIEKEQNKEEIFTAQLDKLQKEIKESKERNEVNKFDLKSVYRAIASLEKVGATIPNYEELTIGKYEALTKVYSEK
jgi:hypothetical protein